ncbi:uncharacterized protein LOC115718844 [Cannabis sativa]|uniref:uncharacterized protein LOC115718844 n=1 Tax=Cannabis sativa TaxID=3483 RepID=UPI0029C9C806|nr:uncharacterized protein LOC115718844 [Cannabis sativa]
MPGGHVASAQILEVNILSANDLATVAKMMKTFVVAWVQLDRKVRTRVDPNGHTNPTWNEKLVFRINYDSLILNDSAASLTAEIYSTSARGVDTLVGSVVVPISSLFPPSSIASHSKMQFMTLQILRPSGRPQGVLNVGVSLLEGTRRSFDLSSVAQSDQIPDPKTYHNNNNNHKNQFANGSKATPKNQLRHSKSERSIMSGAQAADKKGSMCSDVGPSPSVVAAAIAMGLYPRGAATATTMTEDDQTAARSSIVLNNWIEDDSVEGLKTKIERWRSEIHPIYERRQQQVNKINYGRSSYRRNNNNEAAPVAKRSEHRRAGSGGGLFSCFGTAYGCEFSISCGGGSRRHNSKKFDNNGDKTHLSLSEFSYDDPYV